MSLAALLPDTPGLVVEQVIIGKEAITLVARLTTEIACCPCCAQPSSRIHSYARRTLLDRPISGRQVHLSLQVRRFRCGTPSCPRRTFREHVPSLAAPRVHLTQRLLQTLCQVAFALGGEAGARLAKGLGMPCSPDTRTVRKIPPDRLVLAPSDTAPLFLKRLLACLGQAPFLVRGKRTAARKRPQEGKGVAQQNRDEKGGRIAHS
jgi:hypothetical protein